MNIQISDPDRNQFVTVAQMTADGVEKLSPGFDCDIRVEFDRTSGAAICTIIGGA